MNKRLCDKCLCHKPLSKLFIQTHPKKILSLNSVELLQSSCAFHFQKINAINTQYEEKLAALRARHSNRRADFLQRESNVRQQQYEQIIRDPYPSSGMPPREPHGYSNVNVSPAGGEVQRGYSADHFDPYRERARFLASGRDQGFETRGPYPGGRVYDTGSRYYN